MGLWLDEPGQVLVLVLVLVQGVEGAERGLRFLAQAPSVDQRAVLPATEYSTCWLRVFMKSSRLWPRIAA
ncbi:hypothetical protein GCM10009504_06820 [Pseudomonas laurentiana]|nr:hypothetical protein GCM10009504_06820 [Pseudomonas laurentiana]